jgi:hypothetical protein
MKHWESWPYNDFYFIRRCVALWEQNGIYSSVTWEWPDGLSCPEYSTSVKLLEELQHNQHIWELIYIGVVIMGLSAIPWTLYFVTFRKKMGKVSDSQKKTLRL